MLTRIFHVMLHRVRVFLFVIGVTAFIGLSSNRFSDFAWTEHKLDLVSQADNIAEPARQYLGAHVEHAAHIGCLDRNPDLPGVCDYLWYSLLPYYTKSLPPDSVPTGFPYILFFANPRIADAPTLQASRIANYRVELALGNGAFLLTRSPL